MEYLARVKEFHNQSVMQSTGAATGSESTDIEELQNSFGFVFPKAYIEYLTWMGKDYKGIFVGCNWFISDVLGNTELISELLEENGVIFNLPKYYLGFFSHQGYMVAWFELPVKSEDPEVWYYSEGSENKKPEIAGKFSDFLLKDMQSMASCLQPKT